MIIKSQFCTVKPVSAISVEMIRAFIFGCVSEGVNCPSRKWDYTDVFQDFPQVFVQKGDILL